MTGQGPFNPDEDRGYNNPGLRGIQDQIYELSQRIYDVQRINNSLLNILSENLSGESIVKCDRSLIPRDRDGEDPTVEFKDLSNRDKEEGDRILDGRLVKKRYNSYRGEGQRPSAVKGIHSQIEKLEEKIDSYICEMEGTTEDIVCSTTIDESIIDDVIANVSGTIVSSLTTLLIPGVGGFITGIVAESLVQTGVGEILDSYYPEISEEGEEIPSYWSSEIEYKGIAELMKIIDRRQVENTKAVCEIRDEIKKIRARQEELLEQGPGCSVVEPSDSYEEFDINSQIELVFGSEYPTQGGRIYRFRIPNCAYSPDQLDWEEFFKPLEFYKGRYYARVVWSDSGVRSGTYCSNTEEAERVLEFIKSFSSSTVKNERISLSSSFEPSYTGLVKCVRAVLTIRQVREQTGQEETEVYCYYPPREERSLRR